MKLTCRAVTQTGFVVAILLITCLMFQSSTVLAVNVQRGVIGDCMLSKNPYCNYPIIGGHTNTATSNEFIIEVFQHYRVVDESNIYPQKWIQDQDNFVSRFLKKLIKGLAWLLRWVCLI